MAELIKEQLQGLGLNVRKNEETNWISHFDVRMVYQNPAESINKTFDITYKPAEMSHMFGFVITDVGGSEVIYTSRANCFDIGYSKEDIKSIVNAAIEYVKNKVGINDADKDSFKGYLERMSD